MMTEPKPLASLSASLLARKGAARPAMRRQTALGVAASFGTHDDLGWNDMGYDVDPQTGGPGDHQPTPSGLSPMSRADNPSDSAAAVRAAIDSAIDSAIVAPISASHPIPSDPVTPPVVTAQAELARAMAPEPQPAVNDVAPGVATPAAAALPPAAPAPVARRSDARTRSAAGAKGAFAFTLRLDPERHLRLRLSSATGNKSAQQILIGLLDDYLASQPDIDAFATRLGASN